MLAQLFTDWTQGDPHYFYLRGALWGAVAATLSIYFGTVLFGKRR